jgi:YrbI family 3-deoxy-D-manno-octulosonate 8-phosphate phosphatase
MSVKAIYYDFDGVMTDNKVLVSEDGKESVIVNRSDGLAVSYFKELKIEQAIISSETNLVVEKRAKKLKIPVYQNVKNKLEFVKKLLDKNNLNSSEIIFVGNDLNDLEVINYLPNTFCPKDSNKKILDSPAFILNKKGGKGVIMALYEHMMEKSLE